MRRTEQSPEYLALKARLQSLADEQAYNQLLAPSSSHSNPYGPSPIFASANSHGIISNNNNGSSNEEDHDPISPSLVINIFMSVLLCGFATFWALKNFQTPSFFGWVLLSHSSSTTAATTTAIPTRNSTAAKDPVFVLISIFVGILVGVAETVVYAAYLRKVKQAKAAERNIRERKEVVASSVLSKKTNLEGHHHDDDEVVGAKEEVKIWGKGANGGVRRRVRERWENEN